MAFMLGNMFKIELHCHTDESSCCGKVPAAEIVQLYKDAGYDGIVITDHLSAVIDKPCWEESVDYLMAGYKAALDAGEKLGVKIYFGSEIRFPDSPNDYLLLGISPKLIAENPFIYKTTLKDFRRFADANGILIVQAHPFRNPCTPAEALYLDGMEIFNGHIGHDSHNDLAEAYCAANELIPTAGSDCHYYHAVGTAAMLFPTLPADEFMLCEMIKAKNYKIYKIQGE